MFKDASLQFSPLWPLWLTVTVGAVLGLALAWSVVTLLRKSVSPRWVALLGSLRLAAVVVFFLLVLWPVLTETREVEQLPEMLVLVDASPGMAGPTAAGKGSRLEELLSASREGKLADALRDRFRLRWFVLNDTARPLDEGDLPGLKPSGGPTRLARSLEAAAVHARALGGRPARVLLLSDGNDHGRADPAVTARRFGLAVDVLPPSAPATSAPGPLQIAEVQSARRVLLGSETHFRLTLRGDPPAPHDRSAQLALTENGKEVWSSPVAIKAGLSEQTFSLSHRPTSVGLKQYEFRLRPADRGAAAAERPFRLNVQVADSKYEVLVLEDTWRWEYKFLHRLFEDDPSFRFTAFLARGGRTYSQFGSPDRRVKLIGPPQGRADLEGFDTVFLGDVDPARWPRDLAPALARLVTDEGRSLVVTAGPNLGRLAAVPELHALLPVELTKQSGNPVEGPIPVRLRPDAGNSPFFFQLRSGAATLPAVDRVYPALRKRPGATVLLEAVKQRNQYGNLIVLAEHTVGRGRVLFVGTDTLWKWHTLAPAKDGPTPYSIFWQQACRALTPLRSGTGAVTLWLTPQRTQAEVGQPLEVQAEIQSDRPLPRVALEGTVVLPDEGRLPLSFTADPGNPRKFRAVFAPPRAGQVRVTAKVQVGGKTAAEAVTAVQVNEPSVAGPARGVDRAALERLASVSGGRVLDPNRPETWPAADERLPPVPRLHTVDFAGNLTLLLLLGALLGIDWVVRLFKGLV